jgi:hypothetical protein
MPNIDQNSFTINENLLHLIEIALNSSKGKLKNINSTGLAIAGDFPQILSIRIEFDNGCIANIYSDYTSNTEIFNLDIFESRKIINVDLLKNKVEIKSYPENNLLKIEKLNPLSTFKENHYAIILKYLTTYSKINAPVVILENFKNTLIAYKKIKEKIYRNIQ